MTTKPYTDPYHCLTARIQFKRSFSFSVGIANGVLALYEYCVCRVKICADYSKRQNETSYLVAAVVVHWAVMRKIKLQTEAKDKELLDEMKQE